MREYLISQKVDDDGIKVTMTTKDDRVLLDHLYAKLTDRLLRGTKPDPWSAIETLQERYPKRLASVIGCLVNNYSVEGIKDFEKSMIGGFKKCNKWKEE